MENFILFSLLGLGISWLWYENMWKRFLREWSSVEECLLQNNFLISYFVCSKAAWKSRGWYFEQLISV